MEKGFNDDELADIMNEIESLEQDFADDSQSHDEEQPVESKQEEVEVPEEEIKSVEEASASEMKEVLDDLSHMPEEKSIPKQAAIEKVHHLKQSNNNVSGQSTSMQFYVEGNMNIDLGFYVGGQKVNIAVSEDEGLIITLESGVKFTVPLEGGVANRKAS